MRKHLHHNDIDYSVITSNIVSPGFNCCKIMVDATIILKADSRIGCICNHPTERSRPIDIVWFAIQHWRAADEIVLKHIKGALNPSGDRTNKKEALGWILYDRHSRRVLGHYRPKTIPCSAWASKPSFTS
jgi:hypothetical protein